MMSPQGFANTGAVNTMVGAYHFQENLKIGGKGDKRNMSQVSVPVLFRSVSESVLADMNHRYFLHRDKQELQTLKFNGKATPVQIVSCWNPDCPSRKVYR